MPASNETNGQGSYNHEERDEDHPDPTANTILRPGLIARDSVITAQRHSCPFVSACDLRIPNLGSACYRV